MPADRFETLVARAMAGDAVAAPAALQTALGVHRNNALAATIAALADNFPVVRALVGEAAFAALARHHAAHDPPADARLCLYGAGFAATIAGRPELEAWPWLADVARLEWRVVQCLFAADPPRRALRLRLDRGWPLAPATRWLASPWPVASLWHAHQPGAAFPDAFGGGELAVVVRGAGGVAVLPLPADARPLLVALAARTPLAALPASVGAGLTHLPALAAAGALVAATGALP
jgi:hypothetical protein